MKDARIIVLKLHKEGKISEEEATELLDALSNDQDQEGINRAKDRIYRTIDEGRDRFEEKTHDFKEDFEESFGEFEDRFEDFGDDLSRKMSRLGGLLAQTSTSIADKILHSVEEALSSDELKEYDLFSNKKEQKETHEYQCSEIKSSTLHLSSYSGRMRIEAWDQDFLRLKAKFYMEDETYESYGRLFTVDNQAEGFTIRPKSDKGFYGILTLYLPKDQFKKLDIHNKNGSLSLEGLEGEEVQLHTKNGSIQLNRCDFKNSIDLETKNSKILLRNLRGGDLRAQTKNGKILVEDASLVSMDLKTSLGTIGLDELNYRALTHLNLATSHGHIKVLSPIPADLGVSVDAQTRRGEIYLGGEFAMSEEREEGDRVKVRGATPEFDSFEKQLTVTAHTVNGDIHLF